MKRIFTLLSLVAMVSSFSLQKIQSIDDVIAAIKNSNAQQVAKYFDNTVEMTLPGKSSSFSKAQAAVVLKDFFSNNPIKGFETMHKGENTGNEFCIGTLITKTGNFRMTVYMKQRGDVQVLQELKFER